MIPAIMKQMNKIVMVIAISLLGQYAMAQPPARKKEKERKSETTVYEVPMSDRAKSQYPKTVTPDEVAWKRDIYRVLDLEKEKNASLYYPVQPMGKSVNLFTHIFRHVLDKSITAYEYNLEGYENFTDENRVDPRKFLDNHEIYYEFTGEDSTLVVNAADMPSNAVLSYYIKESYYYDQRTAAYNCRVTAICPVLHKKGEFNSEVTKYPLFWLKYDEVSQLLAAQSVMSSSYNNVSTMTFDDYFKKRCYEGEIYKTVNLRNLAISQYCKDSTEIKKEQEKIEKQLEGLRSSLWNTPQPVAEDSTAVAASDSIATDGKNADKEEKASARKARSKKQKEAKVSKKKSSKSSGSPRVSVRRQRR